jgi:hypothetical protein
MVLLDADEVVFHPPSLKTPSILRAKGPAAKAAEGTKHPAESITEDRRGADHPSG